jgi:predicted sulfurtransferase
MKERYKQFVSGKEERIKAIVNSLSDEPNVDKAVLKENEEKIDRFFRRRR